VFWGMLMICVDCRGIKSGGFTKGRCGFEDITVTSCIYCVNLNIVIREKIILLLCSATTYLAK
jgi:hypothetical protein